MRSNTLTRVSKKPGAVQYQANFALCRKSFKGHDFTRFQARCHMMFVRNRG